MKGHVLQVEGRWDSSIAIVPLPLSCLVLDLFFGVESWTSTRRRCCTSELILNHLETYSLLSHHH